MATDTILAQCDTAVWVLLILTLLCVVWVLGRGWRSLRLTGEETPAPVSDPNSDAGIKNEERENIEENEEREPDHTPFLSVIVYSTDGEDIGDFLDSLAEQTMDDYEVVVVNDAGHEATAALAERYEHLSNVYFTFLPSESRNVSRLKLAYTIGIKGAKGDVVLTTTANCRIPSDEWLQRMSAPFADPEVDVVLGYSHFDFNEMGGTRWWRGFESVITASQWIGGARSGHPYRGDRHNLAFRRRLFFEQDGYSATNHLHTGDDDLFVAAIANGANTRVELSPQSILTQHWGSGAAAVWHDARERYDFTARWLPRRAFRITACTQLLQWLVPLMAAAALFPSIWFETTSSIWSAPYFWGGVAAVAATLVMWGGEIALYRRAAAPLQAVRLWWSVVPFMMWRPVANLLFRINHHRDRTKNYTRFGYK